LFPLVVVLVEFVLVHLMRLAGLLLKSLLEEGVQRVFHTGSRG
jgi:hypothetical protein